MANQNARQDQNQFPALIAHTGTAGTAETVRLIATNGTLAVSASLGNVTVDSINDVGTIGSIQNIGAIHNAGTVSSGSLANIGFIHEIGTMPAISIGESTGGTLDILTRAGNIGTLELGTIVGNVADNGVDSGNPVKAGGKYNNSLPTYADGDRGDLQIDDHGYLRVRLGNNGVDVNTSNPGDNNPTSGGLVVTSQNLMYDGSDWDRVRGDSVDGMLVNMGTNNDVAVTTGTITTGSLTNIAYIHEIGTMPSISIGESTGGTLDIITRVGNVGTLELGSVVVNSIPQVSIGTLPTQNLTTGTITTGSLANIGYIHEIGTMPAIAIGESTGGTIDLLSSITNVANVSKGTISMLHAGTINNATITSLPDPLGSVVVTAGTMVTTGDLSGGTVDLVSQAIMAGTDSGGTVYSMRVDTDGNPQIDIVNQPTVTISGDLAGGTVDLISQANVSIGTFTADIPGGTVDLVSNVGSLSNIAYIHEIGTMPAISIGESTGGTLDLISQANVSVGTFTADIPGGTTDLVTRVGNLGTMELGSVVVNSLPTLNLTTGTVTTGSLANITTLHNGTVVVSTMPNINVATGTQQTLGTVANINNGTIRQDTRPAGSIVQNTHTLGTGGTIVGTLVAPTGAGTTLYLTGLSIVGHSGTCDYAIARSVAGSTGAGVYARGVFAPGGGIARDFESPISLGTNGTLTYFVTGNGTASFTVDYIIST